MIFNNIIIMGYGKMPADCAGILLDKSQSIQHILETEKSDFSPLQGLCTRFNIPFKRFSRNETTSFLESVEESTAVLSINNNYIFPQKIVEKDNLRIINFHNSMLPSYPGHGRIIPSWAVFNGETRHGVTWHVINADIDAGDILRQEEFAIGKDDIVLKIMMKAISLGEELFSKHWQEFIDSETVSRPQGQRQGRIYRNSDIPNDGYVDIKWDFDILSRFLRSMDYGPFNILPLPRIIINKETYIVKRYSLNDKVAFENSEVRYITSQEVCIQSAEFEFKEGLVKLIIRKENRNE